MDGLSRLQSAVNDDLVFFSDLHHGETVDTSETDPVLVQQVKDFFGRDQFYMRLISRVLSNNWKNTTRMELPFFRARKSLSVDNGLLYHQDRLYIPSPYRVALLVQVHDTHMGVHQTLKKCAMSAWWPNMARDVHRFVADCETCNKVRFCGTPSTDTWPESQPWERIHIDWAQHQIFGNILIVVDSGSSWIEAFICQDRSTATVQRRLLEIFSRFGVPKTVVSDNGPEFVALKQWLLNMNCRKIESPAYKPTSNGIAEWAVQTVKRAIAAYTPSMGSRECYLLRVLFNHRIASGACKRSPASKLLRIEPRPAVNPFFEVGQPVLYRNSLMKTPIPASYIVHAGRNTAWIATGNQTRFVSVEQLQEDTASVQPSDLWGNSALVQPVSPNAAPSRMHKEPSLPVIRHPTIEPDMYSHSIGPSPAPPRVSGPSPKKPPEELRRSQRLAQGVPRPNRYGWDNDVTSTNNRH